MRPMVRGGYPVQYTKHPERVFHDPILHNSRTSHVSAELERHIISDEKDGASDKYPSEEEISERAKTLEPRDIVNLDGCYSGHEEGICYGEVTCRRLRGNIIGYCPGLRGACCVFYRSCGGKTAQEVSYFRNEAWPREERLRETCSFSIMKRDPSVCGMKLYLEKLTLPDHVGKCSDSFLWITGIPRRRIDLICGQFTGASYQFNITSSTEVFVKIKSYSGYESAWSIAVKQMPCSEFLFEDLPQIGDGTMHMPVDTQSATSLPSSIPTTITTMESTTGSSTKLPSEVPVSSSILTEHYIANCGYRIVRGEDAKANEKPSKENLVTPAALTTVRPTETREEIPVKWNVPELRDSYFYKLSDRGSPTILGQRITYGQVAEAGEFPWQVAIFTGKSFHCGGSIIDKRFILTAAHCVTPYKHHPDSLRIVVGRWDISKAYKPSMEDILVESVRFHANYSRHTLQNDISVLKLSKDIVFNQNVGPVCLPSSDLKPEGELAYVTGWGKDQTGNLVSKLHKLQSSIVDNETCDLRWKNKGASEGFIVPSMVCMDAQNGDSCNGDSGGPSVLENPGDTQRYMQVGIVSFGSGSCTDKNLPGVYTRVSYYVDWIQSQMH